ncbi:MAG: SusC/RagA family TonB-linked outer membrane protein [Prevotella sp.]|nr:SusC/RagA family TonB-linked outer membrane protein [Prevotella sp.]
MKKYILFGLSLLTAFPLATWAQDADDDEEQVSRKSFSKKQAKYETRTVKGCVVDAASGKPLSGAIVSAYDIEGYSVLTEDDGSFELKLPVVASALSISAPDHNAALQGVVKDEMQPQVKLYPTTLAPDLRLGTNLRGDQQASDFGYTSAINIKDEVQKQLGAVAYTTTRNGTPGVGSVMFVQGLNSLNVNAQPLVVVDGVIQEQQYDRTLIHQGFYNDILTNINPADIEKVTVMRNGTALYGAKGANGVILIQTRRNKSMATRITANVSAGVSFEPKYYSMMGAEQYRGYVSELLKTTGTEIKDFKFLNEDPNYYYYAQYHNDTDWKKEVYRTALTQNYGINVEGGDDVANYNLSVGYTSAKSNMEFNDMSRLNIRFNTDIDLTYRFKVRFDASFSNLTRNIRDDGAPAGYDEGTPTAPSFLAYVKSPFMSPYTYGRGVLSDSHYDIDDETYLDEALANYPYYNYQLANPMALNEYGDAKNKNRFENSLLNLSVTPKFLFTRNLALQEHFSYTLVNTNEMYYIPVNGVPSYYVSSVNAWRDNEVRSLASRQESVYSDTRLSWNNRYGGHSIDLFGGVRIMWENYSMNNQLGYNTGSDKTPFMHSGLMNAQDDGIKESWNQVTWYAQAGYNYLSRYYLQANLTADGSSRFGKEAGGLKVFGASWGIFPSVQASWVMSNEPWMARVPGVNYLKLTAGFDVSGNDDIDVNAARSYFRARRFMESMSGLSFSGIGNEGIKWETTRRLNAGLEGNFVNNRIHFAVNYFRAKTTDLLTLQQVGFLSGLSENWSNGGAMKNEGFDVQLGFKALVTKNWQWEIGASMGHYKNKITELADGRTSLTTDLYGATILTEVGKAANLFYGYRTEGVFATSEEAANAGLYILGDNGVTKNYFKAGDMHFFDRNGDHQITEADRVVIGDPNPDIYGNIFTTLAFKRLKLDLRFNYSLGNDVYNYMRSQLENGSRFLNQTTALARRWQIEGQQTDIPQISFQDPMGNSRFSDRWIEDGSYLKLKTVTLSYDLPINSEFIQGLQFWVQANNVFTLSKYLGTDPEVAMTGAVLGQGIDLGRIAQSRSLVAGVKINL